ncbi:hypothetical protein DFH06DRAFT_1327798 [Mycena polygramma]|nr:hypothetical protein DFH06DRAFT_1327798 [Mycena polygramma]
MPFRPPSNGSGQPISLGRLSPCVRHVVLTCAHACACALRLLASGSLRRTQLAILLRPIGCAALASLSASNNRFRYCVRFRASATPRRAWRFSRHRWYPPHRCESRCCGTYVRAFALRRAAPLAAVRINDIHRSCASALLTAGSPHRGRAPPIAPLERCPFAQCQAASPHIDERRASAGDAALGRTGCRHQITCPPIEADERGPLVASPIYREESRVHACPHRTTAS